ncbi:hypothetical protein PanWU01x14_239010 [Parasponia andersonii]|uniref:Stress response NST1-like protein n=1 Tax=Parasponia andersonii TaxID=3476 RepID=A0A2P5BHH3_PARAD|nr:hypothetical protein PanWU01x14_239010 [Parasponia andersonii]
MELHTPPKTTNNGKEKSNADLQNPNSGENHDNHESQTFFEDFDSACSTPYVSAPSSPGRGPVSGFFYSAPASPMHFVLASSSVSFAQSSSSSSAMDDTSVPLGFEFEFSARFGSTGSAPTGSMSSADELFLNGQIRPMKLSTHLERPQVLAPLLDLENENEEDDDEVVELSLEPIRGRDLRLRDKSLRRRTRSMSPMRNSPFDWAENENNDKAFGPDPDGKSPKGSCSDQNKNGEDEEDQAMSSETTTPSVSASSSRSSSAGRNSRRWLFLKEFLRSKSEGRSNNKFWSTISFSPAKEKKPINRSSTNSTSISTTTTSSSSGGSTTVHGSGSKDQSKISETQKKKARQVSGKKSVPGKPTNGVGKRRVPPSAHELHYTTNRAQAEEMRKKTYLPYRQGLLGCLGFSSKGYGAMNGIARALNPVSSR